MFQKLMYEWIEESDTLKKYDLWMSPMMVLKNFTAWLDTRRPSMRAPDAQATTDAIHDAVQHLFNEHLVEYLDCENIERILRERLGRR